MQRKIKFLFFLIPIIALVQISKAQNHCTCTDSLHHLYYRHDSLCNGVEKLPWQYQIGATTITVQPNGNVSNNGDVHGSKETTYKNGKRVKVVTYFSDNKIESIGNYNSNDELDSLYTEYYEYPSEGNGLIYKLNSKIIYKNGEMIHKKYYGKNGQLSQTYDKIDSNYINADWYNNNQKRNEETFMPGGIEVDKRWWSNGHLISKQTIKDSLLVNLECNDTNGTSINIGSFKNSNGILLRYCEIWNEFSPENFYNSKKVKSSYTYINGRMNGVSVDYYNYPNDTSGVSYYKNDTLNGRYIEYYPNHKKKAIGFYKKGIENGVKREYNESGVLVKEITYLNGKEVKQKNIVQHKVVVDDKKEYQL